MLIKLLRAIGEVLFLLTQQVDFLLEIVNTFSGCCSH